MILEPGRQLLHYRLTEKLGEGGMGVVWRAVDTTLDREVAIKVLPVAFAADTERLLRFEREAKLLATLNHPNIASIHSLHEASGERFLALELVEGEDLAAVTARGPLPLEDGLEVCLGIARALEAAHERGVIHRDLKPANVKRGADGTVKVLDFGLAKAVQEPGSSGASPTFAPTATSAGTRAGVILGTAAYMSPEQARGKPHDARTDLWSFGCVLYECLTGKVLFRGETVSDSLAAILRKDPDWAALPVDTPPGVRALLRRCLSRDPARRQQSAGDARVALLEAIEGIDRPPDGASSAASASPSRRPWWIVALVAGLLLGGAVASRMHDARVEADASVARVAIPIPVGLRLTQRPQLTPDGAAAVFGGVDVTPGVDHSPRLYVRRLDEDTLLPVRGTDEIEEFTISPDGHSLAFVAPTSDVARRARLFRVPLDQSTPPQAIGDWANGLRSPIWLNPDVLVAVDGRSTESIVRFPAAGGLVESIPLSASAMPYGVRLHFGLPDGRHVLARAVNFDSGAYLQSVALIDTMTGQMRTLVADGSAPALLRSGHLVFGRADQILVVPFDIERLEVTGPERAVLDGVWAEGAYTAGRFGVSRRGDLAYYTGGVQGARRRIEFLDRDGQTTPWSEDRLEFNALTISPDGRRLATQIDNTAQGDALLQIRVSDLDRPRLVTVGSQPGMDCSQAVWSTRSDRLAYICGNQTEFVVYVLDASGHVAPRVVARLSAEVETSLIGFGTNDSTLLARRVSSDGADELIAISASADPEASTTRTLELDDEAIARPVMSNDGNWLLYLSDVGGRNELALRSVSQDGSLGPRRFAGFDIGRWFFFSPVDVDTGYEIVFERDDHLNVGSLVIEPAPELLDVRDLGVNDFELNVIDLDALPDGRFMIIRRPDSERGAAELRLVLSWAAEVEQLVP